MKFVASQISVLCIAACVLLGCNRETAVEQNKAVREETSAQSANVRANNLDVVRKVEAVLKSAKPGIRIDSVEPSRIDGLFTVRIAGGATLYITRDGTRFITGDLYEIGPNGLVNVTDAERSVERKQLLANIPREQSINFTPKEVKGTAFVFTDVDCFYCQKLHKGMARMNELGIEVRYLAYPRAGLNSPSFQKIASAWCAQDKQDALTRLKNREQIPLNVCQGNPVANQFMLGGRLGVRGTPAIFLADGTSLPGYVTPEQLAARMNIPLK